MYIPKHVYTIRQGKSQLAQPFCSIQVFNPLGRPIHVRESSLFNLVYLFKCSSRLETASPTIMFNQMSGHPMTNQFSSVQSLSLVQIFATPWTVACQASLSITNFQSLLKLISIESVIPSNHLILCLPLLLPTSIFPRIMVFSNESVLRIRWPKYWSFSFSVSPSNEYSGLISFRMDWLDLLANYKALFIV